MLGSLVAAVSLCSVRPAVASPRRWPSLHRITLKTQFTGSRPFPFQVEVSLPNVFLTENASLHLRW